MIKENIAKLRQRISEICFQFKHDPAKVKILAVTKGRGVAEIQEALSAGLDYLGENRVQEAAQKYLRFTAVHWQMVGHLQKNKVKDALKIFELIHSVDSLALAQEINRQAAKIGKIQDILLEVKTSPEASKTGFSDKQLAQACVEIGKLKQLKVKGLMTIAPPVNLAEQARPYFAKLRRLRQQLDPSWLLSMGMSDDFQIAIEEGADIIRLGRAIFDDDVKII